MGREIDPGIGDGVTDDDCCLTELFAAGTGGGGSVASLVWGDWVTGSEIGFLAC